MKQLLSLLMALVLAQTAFAHLRYHPVTFTLTAEKESYYEGETINFLLLITNTDKERSHPVLLPHTQNTGQKLFYLNLYDKAGNTLLLRATEDRQLHMMVHNTGSVKIRYLKPLEKLIIPLRWNDFENYYSYHTQNASHHSFGVPLFAGQYQINVCYNPKGIALGDSIYTYYTDFDKNDSAFTKLAMHEYGQTSNFCALNIRKTANDVIAIEGKKYYTRWDNERHRCWYYTDSIGEGGSNPRLVHVTNLPTDSFTLAKDEYFYSHFTDQYAEYIVRFDNGDIQEYRKFRDYCPEEIYTERYNSFKQRIYFAQQLPDGRFYTVSYHQPSGNKHQEIYYAADGTLCVITDYVYNKKEEFIKTKTHMAQPCIMVELGKSYRKAVLEGK